MTEVSAHSAGYEEVPRVWPFNATEKLDPDVRELLSMHCSWCVLDCGEAQITALEGLNVASSPRRSHPPKPQSSQPALRKRTMSASARRQISAAPGVEHAHGSKGPEMGHHSVMWSLR